MTVAELIKHLQTLPQDLSCIAMDGSESKYIIDAADVTVRADARAYDYSMREWVDLASCVDIG